MTRTFQRALITGLGAVTPIGNDVESYWEGLRTGRNGIGLVKRFDPSDLIVQIAADGALRSVRGGGRDAGDGR